MAHDAPWAREMPQSTTLTPLGEITISAEDNAIVALDWGRGRDQGSSALLAAACAQLHEYFDGRRADFDLPLRPHGTAFQRRVWSALRGIAAGQTVAYGSIAALLSTSARAVGQAAASNPIPIIIPCHRLVGTRGWEGGYAGGDGRTTKRWLISHEARCIGICKQARTESASPAPPIGAGRQETTHR